MYMYCIYIYIYTHTHLDHSHRPAASPMARGAESSPRRRVVPFARSDPGPGGLGLRGRYYYYHYYYTIIVIIIITNYYN